MPAIEITTTQNVVIQYQVATLFDRMVAFLFDFIAIALLYVIMTSTLLNFFEFGSQVVDLLPVIILSFYSLVWERFSDGQTLGKKLVSIKVIKVDGGQPDGVEYFKRWSMRLLDVYLSFGSVAMLSISSNELGQRVGDKVADTIVIKIKKGGTYSVKDLSNLASADDYQPKYPEVLILKESYVIDLKRLVSRYSKSGQSAKLLNLIAETSAILESELNISRKDLKPIDFIRQVIRDYVILTR